MVTYTGYSNYAQNNWGTQVIRFRQRFQDVEGIICTEGEMHKYQGIN